MSKERLIQAIIEARFGKKPDAKLYEPVSTDVLFLLKPFYSQVAMSNDGFISYGIGYSVGCRDISSPSAFYSYIIECKTLNEDGSPTKLKEWSKEDCNTILEIISKNI